MYSALQRLNTLATFFSSALIATLLLIAALNFVMPYHEPKVRVAVNRVSLYFCILTATCHSFVINRRRGIEDYYVNKSSWLADLSLDIEAGIMDPNLLTIYLWLRL